MWRGGECGVERVEGVWGGGECEVQGVGECGVEGSVE